MKAIEQVQLKKPDPHSSLARESYHEECEAGVNVQINVEYNASYAYHALSSYCERDNVSLPGLASFFRRSSLEEREDAQAFMDFQFKRGGRVKFGPLLDPKVTPDYMPEKRERFDSLACMEVALALEKAMYAKLKELHACAEHMDDETLQDFVEDFQEKQVAAIKEVADYVAQLRRVGPGHGEWHFDRQLAAKYSAPFTTPV